MTVTNRLKKVQIESQPAVKLINRYNRSDVLIYADPPYLLSTRSKRMYRYEMNDNDHLELLKVLNEHSGPVLLSGYNNDLYNTYLKDWKRVTKDVKAERGRDREEVLWLNPIAVPAFEENQLSMF